MNQKGINAQNDNFINCKSDLYVFFFPLKYSEKFLSYVFHQLCCASCNFQDMRGQNGANHPKFGICILGLNLSGL